MDWKPRLIDADELPAAADLLMTAFAVAPTRESERKLLATAGEPDRMFGVHDGGRLVGFGGNYTFQLAVPDGGLPAAGVSWVGVLPTHRRQGILSTIMGALLDQAIEREEPVAALTASEGGIYRRFGFGVSARYQTVVVDTTEAQALVGLERPGRVRLVDEEQAAALLPAVWRAHWERTPGELDRSPGWWAASRLDLEEERGGGGPRFVAVHEDPSGTVDGYAVYRFVEGGAAGGDYNEVRIDEVIGIDYDVEAALVRYLLDLDLVRQLRWQHASMDLPLLWQLRDPRAARVVEARDHMWLRLLDVVACLGDRTYAADGGVVLDVADPARPQLGGRFMLDAGPDGADCLRTSAEADVVVAAPDLASLYLGTVSWRTLHLAGLVEERSTGAIARLDNLFRPDRAPYCTTDF
jgi:predicted acetyltransferase